MSREECKKARTEGAEVTQSDGLQPESPAPESGGGKLEDGLSFWVASRTIGFKVTELEVFVKKAMLSAGFSVEECSVSVSYLWNVLKNSTNSFISIYSISLLWL